MLLLIAGKKTTHQINGLFHEKIYFKKAKNLFSTLGLISVLFKCNKRSKFCSVSLPPFGFRLISF